MSNNLEGNLVVGLFMVFVLGFPILTGWIARRKGYSFVLFFLFALLCLVPALITTMVLTDRDTGERFGFGT